MTAAVLANNLWVVLCGLFVFMMTIAVGLLEVGELGERVIQSLVKTILITGLAVLVMAVVGFNTAFAPTVGGIIGNPFYGPGLVLGAFSPGIADPWWSVSGAGLRTGTYFLFETAFAAVTLALVGVVALHKMKLSAFAIYSVIYFVIIWALPAAWIWNPSGWLAKLGMVDFAGGLVVHGAAGAAGLGIVWQIWREEKANGLKTSEVVPYRVNAGWLTIAILLLWVGWFGFNPGSVLAFNDEALIVVETTFIAAATAMVSTSLTAYILTKELFNPLYVVNGILMGLIVITPLAGFVSPGSALILGVLCGPIFCYAEKFVGRAKWMSDPVGLFPGHLVGGIFGVLMIAFFAQNQFAIGSGFPTLPNGVLFGGGGSAVKQLGIEIMGIVVAVAVVFLISNVTVRLLAALMKGITNPPVRPEAAETMTRASEQLG
ncbi:MAG TPA: ammonium transporter [Candidatus Dormibacteraeota bacterium]|nr:ammonium transporter [Candidatus Dormibacteraeota bacterium]